ncbi:Delta-like protein D [Dissostichus eleginoides]|uniref:Delta-like protein D n=1 Tax=Dissostichus eleginoides TaxID=100907 RepID=A0AAD9BP67_DISEL|nr:Delta-like protein D [Dissostichus eleginoides]
MPTPGVKNINKKMDFCSSDPDEVSPPGRSSYKSRHQPSDYNLVQEVHYEQAAKEAMLEAASEDKCQSHDSFEFEEKRSKRLKCDSSEKNAPEMSACADTKYKSVFVMSEEKDECIIATEVSFRCFTLLYISVLKLVSLWSCNEPPVGCPLLICSMGEFLYSFRCCSKP